MVSAVLFLVIVVVFVFIPASSPALETAASLPEIIVTASKSEEPIEDVTHDITVVTRREIEQKSVDLLPDLLRSLSDVQITQNGGAGKNATIFLRGGSPNQVVIMIDGVKLNNPTTGSVDLSGIPADDIERIEILKGPQGTLYGSEAMAGVVNIVTKRGQGPPSLSLTGEGGAFTTIKGGASLSGSSGMWDYKVAASYLDTNGISAAASGTEKDSYTNRFATARIGITPSARAGLEVTARYEQGRSDLDDFDLKGNVIDSPTFIQNSEQSILAAKGYVSFSDQYQQILRASRTSSSLRFTDPVVSYNNARIDTTSDVIDWQHLITMGTASLSAGGEMRRDNVENAGSIDATVTNYALYINGKLKIVDNILVASGGLRYDHYETVGSQTTYRAGVLWAPPGYGIRFKANYGTGFRAPSLNELYFPFFGNPNLRPETSKGVDGGFDAAFLSGKIIFNATYFSQDYRDLIQYDFQTYSAQNIGEAAIKGVELGLAATPSDALRARISYTYLDTVDKDTDMPLTRRPRHKVLSQIEYSAGKWNLLGEYVYLSQRYDSASYRTLSPYWLVNIYSTYRVDKNVTLFARISNLFNTRYEEVGGYGTPGTAVYCGMKVYL